MCEFVEKGSHPADANAAFRALSLLPRCDSGAGTVVMLLALSLVASNIRLEFVRPVDRRSLDATLPKIHVRTCARSGLSASADGARGLRANAAVTAPTTGRR